LPGCWLRKRERLLAQYDLQIFVTGIITGRHGQAIDPDGIDLERALALVESGGRWMNYLRSPRRQKFWILSAPARRMFV
jgi:homoserine dehydrogenase